MKNKLLVRSIIVLVLSSLLLIITSCKKEQKQVKPIVFEFKKEGELSLFKSISDSLIATFDIEIADDEYETQTGLMHRKSMANKRAMLFIFPDMRMRAFYMKNTYIPLDIIYLDKDKVIVSIQENAKPLDETALPSGVPAQYVLEINGGLSQQWSIAVGDKIDFKQFNE